jgi:hypothetical protein
MTKQVKGFRRQVHRRAAAHQLPAGGIECDVAELHAHGPWKILGSSSRLYNTADAILPV